MAGAATTPVLDERALRHTSAAPSQNNNNAVTTTIEQLCTAAVATSDPDNGLSTDCFCTPHGAAGRTSDVARPALLPCIVIK